MSFQIAQPIVTSKESITPVLKNVVTERFKRIGGKRFSIQDEAQKPTEKVFARAEAAFSNAIQNYLDVLPPNHMEIDTETRAQTAPRKLAIGESKKTYETALADYMYFLKHQELMAADKKLVGEYQKLLRTKQNQGKPEERYTAEEYPQKLAAFNNSRDSFDESAAGFFADTQGTARLPEPEIVPPKLLIDINMGLIKRQQNGQFEQQAKLIATNIEQAAIQPMHDQYTSRSLDI